MNKHFEVKSIVSKTVRVLTLVLLWTLAMSLLLSMFWMVYSSLKDNISFQMNSFSLPKLNQIMFSNYAEIWTMIDAVVLTSGGALVRYKLWDMFFFSLLLSVGTAVMGVLMPAVTSYAVSKYKTRFGNFLYAVAIFVMILPIVGALPSQMLIMKSLGIYDNIVLFILTSAGPFGFNFILLAGAWKSLPWAYAEAAFIDGAGHMRVFIQIMVPMMMPMFAALFILGFIGSWNDYMTPIIWLPSIATLASGMYGFQNKANSFGIPVTQLLAGLVILSIPSSALFIASQKVIMSQLTVGGLK